MERNQQFRAEVEALGADAAAAVNSVVAPGTRASADTRTPGSGYLTFQRAGGYAVISVGPDPRGGVSVGIKVRRDPFAEPAYLNPYPELESYWTAEKTRQWAFVVNSIDAIPDSLDAAIALTAEQQPESGPMPKE